MNKALGENFSSFSLDIPAIQVATLTEAYSKQTKLMDCLALLLIIFLTGGENRLFPHLAS